MRETKNRYVAIIVVYNKSLVASKTCSCMKRVKNLNIQIVVVDNSTEDYGNEDICSKQGYTYISMQGNAGLSKAYNVAIDRCSAADLYLLFDDDTEVTEEYFTVLKEAVNNHPEVDIFAPVVYGQDGVIYSPNAFRFLKNRLIASDDQEVPQEEFNAIASCLAIRSRVFENYRFNEILFVDQVDQFFFCEQRALGRTFMKLDTKIQQNFYQRDSVLTPENGWRRVHLRIIDVMRHARLMGGMKYRLMGLIKCCGLAVQIAKKSRSAGIMWRGVIFSCRIFLKPM